MYLGSVRPICLVGAGWGGGGGLLFRRLSPLWSDIGSPGIKHLSPRGHSPSQPSSSPFSPSSPRALLPLDDLPPSPPVSPRSHPSLRKSRTAQGLACHPQPCSSRPGYVCSFMYKGEFCYVMETIKRPPLTRAKPDEIEDANVDQFTPIMSMAMTRTGDGTVDPSELGSGRPARG